MPWGPRTPEDVTRRALECARAAASYGLDGLIIACNTASVHALPALRAAFEPDLPIVGTVPAIKPAAAAHRTVAIWATPATTGSAYQRGLIAEFGNGADVTEVPCPGLADAVQAGDADAVTAAVAAAAALTPPGVGAVVLGCTHYELVGDRIAAPYRARPCTARPTPSPPRPCAESPWNPQVRAASTCSSTARRPPCPPPRWPTPRARCWRPRRPPRDTRLMPECPCGWVRCLT